jgi:4-hydroxybenzoate polyprenyltransferase
MIIAMHTAAIRKVILHKSSAYAQLMRLNRPIGAYLVLWPTLWSLWIAAEGMPDWDILLIFVLGVVLMRGAGCVINDFADRRIDGEVRRTNNRPLITGQVSPREAILLFIGLCAASFILVLFTNRLTIMLSFGGLALAFCYPFMKRYTHLPQVVLGAAFAWSIPMAFAAQAGEVPQASWLLYVAVVLWTVAYDTFYAMVDREDDLKIGVKSTAILFGEQDKVITGCLQFMAVFALVLAGKHFDLGVYYKLALLIACGLFAWQQYLIRNRERDKCFQAFLNNNWVGAVIFIGVALHYSV